MLSDSEIEEEEPHPAAGGSDNDTDIDIEEETEGVDQEEEPEGEEEEDEPYYIDLPKDAVTSEKQIREALLQKINKKLEFRFSINYYLHPDLIPYFWGSVVEYFQEVMEQFITAEGWRLSDFIKCADEKKLHQIYRCTFTKRGTIEQQTKHFKLVFHVILDSAKFQWLCPWKTRNTFGLSVCIKRQVGGLFLCYFLLMKQPQPPQGIRVQEKQKMKIDPGDSTAIRFFLNDLDKLENTGGGKELKGEVKLAFMKLHYLELLEKTGLKDDYSLEAPILLLNGYKTDPRLNYFGLLKDVRDKLLYLTFQGIGNTTFKEVLKVASNVLHETPITVEKKVITKEPRKETFPPPPPSQPTFQTKLRQRLDQQFEALHQKFRTPWLNEMEADLQRVEEPGPSSAPPSRNRNRRSKTVNEENCEERRNESSFPPDPKEHWTVEDVQALKNERDLAIIAFRIVEILRFVTPPNPLTTARLANENTFSIRQNTKDVLKKHVETEKIRYDLHLNSERRRSALAFNRHRQGKRKCGRSLYLPNPNTSSWIQYLKDNGGQSRKYLTPREMLEKLRTHEVVATVPTLFFRPLDKPDDSIPIPGEEENIFDNDSGENEKDDGNNKEPVVMVRPNSAFHDTNMPDLSKFSEMAEEPPVSLDEGPPQLSPAPTTTGSSTQINLSNPGTSQQAGMARKSWFVLADELIKSKQQKPEEVPSASTSTSLQEGRTEEQANNDPQDISPQQSTSSTSTVPIIITPDSDLKKGRKGRRRKRRS